MKQYTKLFKKVRDAGLGITIHTGEAGSMEELRYVVQEVVPNRIGHGIKSSQDKKLMQDIANKNIILEICPTSNLKNSVVKNTKEMRQIFKTLLAHKVKFTINTDGPEMYRTNIMEEENFLIRNGILTKNQVEQCRKWAFESTFIK
jgi:adenosine deaminase